MPKTAPRLRPWTLDEYYRLGELGFFQKQRVELINGKIIEMAPVRNFHVAATDMTVDALKAAFGPGYWVRNQGPLDLSATSSPQPDVAVVRGSPKKCSAANPTTALLVVEVSEATLRIDRGTKARLYARAGIKDYWIVNLVDRQLEVYRSPGPDPARPKRVIYTKKTILIPGDHASPLAAPKAKVAVDDLLP
jgi:Uma2 family endonuclease